MLAFKHPVTSRWMTFETKALTYFRNLFADSQD
jgi:hypothetical protein